MKNFFLSLLILSFLLSCSEKQKKTTGILPKQKMREVMWDMIRAGEFLNSFVMYKDTSMDKTAESQKWYAKIYQIHKVSEKDFKKTYAYYQGHPILMKELLDSLSKIQIPIPKYGQTPLAKKDSANKKDTIALRVKPRKIDTLHRKRILKKAFNTQ